jgi:hypothetical protein
MRKLMFIVVGLVLLFSFNSANAQKEKFHSLFIYNFSKYVKWPDGQQNSEFVIGVLGSADMVKTLESMAKSKTVNGNSIIVRNYKNASEVKDCQILYVSEEASSEINNVLARTSKRPVLIVSDKPGLAQKGSVINFVEQGGKIKFELNQKMAESRGLKVSGSLTSLAILV